MANRLIDPFSPIESTDDADDAYSALHTAAQSGDADLTIKITNGLLESPWVRPEHRAPAMLAAGRVLMAVQRYDEARAWLQEAANGDPDTAEQAYNELAEISRYQGVAGHDVDEMYGAPRHLRAAKEALERHDFATTVDAAVKVFEYDDASVHDKAFAGLLAAQAFKGQGNDDQAELYAGWAKAHGDADQKFEAQYLLDQWGAIAKADASMDDGVTAKEVPAAIEAAEQASTAGDFSTSERLVRELLAANPRLDAAQADRVHMLLGDALRNQHRYAEAVAEYEQVKVDEIGIVKSYLQDLREMQELGEQL